EIEIRNLTRHQRGVRQSGKFILRGVAGNRQRRCHRLAYGLVTAAGGARRTLGLSHVQGDPEPLIAVEFDRLHLALAYRGRQALLHGDRYLTGARTLLARLVDDALNLLAQLRQRLRANTLYFSHLSTPEPEYSSPPVQ